MFRPSWEATLRDEGRNGTHKEQCQNHEGELCFPSYCTINLALGYTDSNCQGLYLYGTWADHMSESINCYESVWSVTAFIIWPAISPARDPVNEHVCYHYICITDKKIFMLKINHTVSFSRDGSALQHVHMYFNLLQFQCLLHRGESFPTYGMSLSHFRSMIDF